MNDKFDALVKIAEAESVVSNSRDECLASQKAAIKAAMDKGMTMRDIGTSLGVTREFVSQLYRGVRRIPARHIRTLCNLAR